MSAQCLGEGACVHVCRRCLFNPRYTIRSTNAHKWCSRSRFLSSALNALWSEQQFSTWQGDRRIGTNWIPSGDPTYHCTDLAIGFTIKIQDACAAAKEHNYFSVYHTASSVLWAQCCKVPKLSRYLLLQVTAAVDKRALLDVAGGCSSRWAQPELGGTAVPCPGSRLPEWAKRHERQCWLVQMLENVCKGLHKRQKGLCSSTKQSLWHS